ncbi:MAG: 3-dehydroquinate synthase [Chloroflexi bacterium]|nr:3-dehydroquinate synthase [Chloroflexota bacterium]
MKPIFLYGPPGVGKSTVGRLVARNLNLLFQDLDALIENKEGRSTPLIMEQRGEAGFRDLESSSLKELLTSGENVIALGGGALLRQENRSAVEQAGKVVVLMAEAPTLLAHLEQSPAERPLLAGDLRGRLSSLLTDREDHYLSFPLIVRVDGISAEEAALEVQTVCGRHHLSAMGEYDVFVQDGGLEALGSLLAARGFQNPMIVTDENVARYHARTAADSLSRAKFGPKMESLPAGEDKKNLETVNRLWRSFLEAELDRKSTVVALGGGVVGDMAGFAASTFMRGIKWVAVPTSLLAMVDASVGGKTGFDLPQGKNLVGSFYPPSLVLADPQVLKTLPEAELISGMAEVVKHGVISDPELFSLCGRGLDWVKEHLEPVVTRAMAVKIKVIEQDPYEKGLRAALNLGHTVGHALELVSGFKLRHGEAVAIGMVVEARYAERTGRAARGLAEEIVRVLSKLGLSTRIPSDLPREQISQAMRVDKKKHAKTIRFALPLEIGRVDLVDVTDLEAVLEDS